MIDSINFTIPKQIDLDLLPNYTSRINKEGVVISHSGKLGSLDIIVNPNYNRTRVKGSIRKYFLGETVSYIQELSLHRSLNQLIIDISSL